MSDLIEYQYNTTGLWSRFITKLIAALFFTFYGSTFLLVSLNINSNPLIFILVILSAFTVVIWVLFKENPLKWRNRVVFDFQKELMAIYNKSNESRTADVLDFYGEQYSFNDIDSYPVIHYESFLFSSYYLVKLFVNGKEIKLLSFKEAKHFTDFIGVLNNRVKIKIKQ